MGDAIGAIFALIRKTVSILNLNTQHIKRLANLHACKKFLPKMLHGSKSLCIIFQGTAPQIHEIQEALCLQ